MESIKIDGNLSCLDVLSGNDNEGIVCGDERGGMHAVYLAAASAGVGSSSLKRVVRALSGEKGGVVSDEDVMMNEAENNLGSGHYGMVTAVAARPPIQTNTPRSSSGVFKGFLEGASGLVVTTGVDWSTKLWAPAYTDEPLLSFLSNSYDYMCDAQW